MGLSCWSYGAQDGALHASLPVSVRDAPDGGGDSASSRLFSPPEPSIPTGMRLSLADRSPAGETQPATISRSPASPVLANAVDGG